MKICPVQTALLEPNIQKYKQASNPTTQQIKDFSEAMASTVNFPLLSLPSFCNVCPWLHRFNMQEATKNE